MTRLTRAQVREIDRRSVEEYGIPTLVLMENAARAVADACCEMLDNNCVGEVLIVCGAGNNAGDGLAAARHIHNRGADVTIALLNDPGSFQGDAAVNWAIVQKMGLTTVAATPEIFDDPAQLVIDAVFGTGLNRPPVEPFPSLVQALKKSKLPVLAVDLPSGLDCDTGRPPGACVEAARTVTFVAGKVGFGRIEAGRYLGRVTVADIGCPRELIEAVAQS
jgi:hydroxyethylthiazole kinase-like uncharacterized protein yjeF